MDRTRQSLPGILHGVVLSTVRLGSNIASLAAQRRLGDATQSLSRTYERLSSGMRINRASDDAAGLAVATSLRSDARVYAQGIRNFNDGVSLLNIADGTINELSSITTRLTELAAQAANGSYGVSQRRSLDAEAQALSKEYLRIAQSTTFNGKQLFGGSFGELRLQGGYGTDGGVQSSLGGAIGTGGLPTNGTFYASGAYVSNDVALGDLNGDGIVDMVTADYQLSVTGRATVRLGQGGGAFAVATSYVAESGGANAVALGDFNGDGILDLATTGFAGGNRATIRLGQGNGTFGAATSYLMDGSSAMSLGDLNGDGNIDIVTVGSGRASVRLGLGDGTFGSSTSYATGTAGSTGVSLGDVNRDGVLDLVTSGSGRATVQFGQGNGSFGTATSYAAEATVYAVTLGDLNGDGVLDLVTAGDSGSDGRATIRLGQVDGSFGTSTSYLTEPDYSRDVQLGDLNGDGILDLITVGSIPFVGGGYITTRAGQGDGTFAGIASYSENIVQNAVAVGDLNQDGVLDIATAGGANAAGATVRLTRTTSGISPLLDFRLTSRADALQALSQFDRAQNRLSLQRGVIGAFQARVSTAISTLASARENLLTAESRITDADMAKESADLVRTQILQQAASAVLVQANQQPALAIKLLSAE